MPVSSIDPLRSIGMLILQGLVWGVPSPSHFLKLERFSRACHLLHGMPKAYLLLALERGGVIESR